ELVEVDERDRVVASASLCVLLELGDDGATVVDARQLVGRGAQLAVAGRALEDLAVEAELGLEHDDGGHGQEGGDEAVEHGESARELRRKLVRAAASGPRELTGQVDRQGEAAQAEP